VAGVISVTAVLGIVLNSAFQVAVVTFLVVFA
jgi:ethanolamine permease